MDAEWLTYREAAKRLGSNIEAVRQRAIRCRWPRTIGNDYWARILPQASASCVSGLRSHLGRETQNARAMTVCVNKLDLV
jgi:hypothetical protein